MVTIQTRFENPQFNDGIADTLSLIKRLAFRLTEWLVRLLGG